MTDLIEIRKWLSSNGRDRNWLALQCGVSKRTVDGWFSSERKLPKLAEQFIERIMQENSFGEIQMSFSDWQLINEAMRYSGYTKFDEFAVDAVKSYVAQKNKDAGQPLTNK